MYVDRYVHMCKCRFKIASTHSTIHTPQQCNKYRTQPTPESKSGSRISFKYEFERFHSAFPPVHMSDISVALSVRGALRCSGMHSGQPVSTTRLSILIGTKSGQPPSNRKEDTFHILKPLTMGRTWYRKLLGHFWCI